MVDEAYDQDLKIYCMQFIQLSNIYELRKNMLEKISKSAFPADHHWIDANCTPNRIGGTASPMIHLVAEEVGGRRKFLEALDKYFQSRRDKDPQLWQRVINARNSRGMTILDYIEFMRENKLLRQEELEDIESLIVYVCSRGGLYLSTRKSCPALR